MKLLKKILLIIIALIEALVSKDKNEKGYQFLNYNSTRNGDPQLLKNYLTITLINNNYKILAFVLAQRFQNVTIKQNFK